MNVKPDTYLSGNSINWQNWESKLTPITCQFCCETHGKIYDIGILVIPSIISHFNCKCEMKPMRTIKAGTVTKNGPTGADAQLSYLHKLPENYISKADAIKSGWIPKKGNLSDVLPKQIIGGDVYKNRNQKLPYAPNRTWKEADFDYTEGYRNFKRILFSNDGLLFATFDHYHTFYEILP
ncbi:MAG: phage head morphogenesis protein [Ruminococcaceae bacterium]|nr:phage head morphogenesis protein [Oscillospiraceae bacterium]